MPVDKDQKRDYAQELTKTLTRARELHSRAEAVIVNDLRQRADLYEGAFVQAKQALIDAAKDAPPPERQARQHAALRKPDVDVLSPTTLRTLAALDARQYGELRHPQRQAEAALVIAETIRLDSGYRVALAEQAPELSQVVQIVAAVTDKGRTANASQMRSAPSNAIRDQVEHSRLRAPPLTLDPIALEHLAAHRTRDFAKAAKQLGLNGIEAGTNEAPTQRATEQEQSQAPGARSTPAKTKSSTTAQEKALDANQIRSDAVFTAASTESKPIVPADVESRYLRVGDKFYHPKNTGVVAFVDKGNQLQTRSDSEQIAATMVAIARARGWDDIKVSGSETFRKEVWLQASAHGMHTKGYTPTAVDQAELAKRGTQVTANQVAWDGKTRERNSAPRSEHPENTNPHEDAPLLAAAAARTSADKRRPVDVRKAVNADAPSNSLPDQENRARAQAFARQSPTDAVNVYPELAGAYAAQALMQKKAAADGLSPKQSAIVMARVAANLTNSIERGDLPQVTLREQVDLQREHTERKVQR